MKPEKSLAERVTALEARNARVESDKAWETSWLRRGAIMVLTYLTVVAYFHFVLRVEPWLNALVPVIGFTLSTLTVAFLKKIWLRRHS